MSYGYQRSPIGQFRVKNLLLSHIVGLHLGSFREHIFYPDRAFLTRVLNVQKCLARLDSQRSCRYLSHDLLRCFSTRLLKGLVDIVATLREEVVPCEWRQLCLVLPTRVVLPSPKVVVVACLVFEGVLGWRQDCRVSVQIRDRLSPSV